MRRGSTAIRWSIVSLGIMLLSGWAVAADPSVVVFYEQDCPDCELMKQVLDELTAEHPDLEIARYEIAQPGTMDLWIELLEDAGVEIAEVDLGVPTLFIGEELFLRARAEDEEAVRRAVIRCATEGCPSPLPSPANRWVDLGILLGFAALLALLYLLQGG
jgi:thiol-disulfide isomerase/thioredoxin